MKIIVCAKIIKGELNPFDACALETALRISNDVTVISMGPSSSADELHRLTRLGAKVLLVSDNAYAGSDTLATAYILSTVIKTMEYDLIICGRQSIDGDTAQVGPSLATMLGIDVVTNVMEVDITDDKAYLKTRNSKELKPLPLLITVERINELRFPSLFSKAGEVKIIDNSVVNADLNKCGLNGSPTKVLKTFEHEKSKRNCQFIDFSQLDSIIKELIKKDKKGINITASETRLKSVWIIGEEVKDIASSIADEVLVINEKDPFKIANMAKEEKPDTILWNADLWGRKNAPIVSALLDTGLCADCTHLETDGEKLFMYRPAFGGNIVAKIECKTKPQMATVRTVSQCSDIIVAGGKGVRDSIDKFKEFANKYNAELGASRGLVDTGILPYDAQIGLTGKSVSPKIYIAIGISGTVQHTCAIENSDYIIAINQDKDARIFEYADYGVVFEF